MQERRQFPRHRTLKSGKIVIYPRASVFDCTVRNLSPKGALLLLQNLSRIPESFDLVLERTGEQHSCRVAWRGEDRLGVEFTSADTAADAGRSRSSAAPRSCDGS
jgi:PilZ domain-containing protein